MNNNRLHNIQKMGYGDGRINTDITSIYFRGRETIFDKSSAQESPKLANSNMTYSNYNYNV